MARVLVGNLSKGASGVGFSGGLGQIRAKQEGINWTPWTVIACLCLFGVLALKVSLELRCTELSYVLAHQQKRTVAYEMERRELDLQLSILQRADVLAEQAEKLGLKPLKAEQIRVL